MTPTATASVTTFCAPPTVWRQLIQLDLKAWKVSVREANSAGEPLNPEVIDRVARAWGVALRDSYGQTETTMMIGNAVGQRVVAGSMGRPLPGYRVVLLDAGRIVADGTHDELLASTPLYSEVLAQAASVEETGQSLEGPDEVDLEMGPVL